MLPSYELIEFLKWWEGLPGGKPALSCYLDQGGVPTIGYGQTGNGIIMGMTCTAEQASEWLTAEVDDVAEKVRNLIAIPTIPQEKFDALVSFAYNVGLGALAGSTLLRYVNGIQFDKAALEFLKWDHVGGKESPGLLKRRHAELMIWTARDYSARP